jgi:hypothetical protein
MRAHDKNSFCNILLDEVSAGLRSDQRPSTDPRVLFIDCMNHMRTSQPRAAHVSSLVDTFVASIMESITTAHGRQSLVYLSFDDPL